MDAVLLAYGVVSRLHHNGLGICEGGGEALDNVRLPASFANTLLAEV
jgi:hypothetical protein